MEAKTVYVHYGSDEYVSEITRRIVNSDYAFARTDKPAGLWASPENAEFGWKDFCRQEQFEIQSLKKSFRFVLTDNARVLRITCLKDAEPYLETIAFNPVFSKSGLALKKMYESFDAVEVLISKGDLRRNMLFWSWDVDSLCVWNPTVVKQIKKEEL